MLKKHWIAISLAFATIILYLFFLRDLPVSSIATDSVERNSISATSSLDRGIIVREEKGDVLRDPYVPPMQGDYRPPCNPPAMKREGCAEGANSRFPPPLFIQTDYSQVGILSQGELILPLFGRRMRRDKWQYYTISNTGTLNTKLPIRINGKSATGEHGCDPIVSNDTVFVEGYKEMMSATIYENNQFSYNPNFLI